MRSLPIFSARGTKIVDNSLVPIYIAIYIDILGSVLVSNNAFRLLENHFSLPDTSNFVSFTIFIHMHVYI